MESTILLRNSNRYIITWMLRQIFMYSDKGCFKDARAGVKETKKGVLNPFALLTKKIITFDIWMKYWLTIQTRQRTSIFPSTADPAGHRQLPALSLTGNKISRDTQYSGSCWAQAATSSLSLWQVTGYHVTLSTVDSAGLRQLSALSLWRVTRYHVTLSTLDLAWLRQLPALSPSLTGDKISHDTRYSGSWGGNLNPGYPIIM